MMTRRVRRASRGGCRGLTRADGDRRDRRAADVHGGVRVVHRSAERGLGAGTVVYFAAFFLLVALGCAVMSGRGRVETTEVVAVVEVVESRATEPE